MIVKLLPRLEEYVKWKVKVSLVSVRHNDGSNVSILEKKTLNIYHILEDINCGIFTIYAKFRKKILIKVHVGSEKNLVHQKIPYINRLKQLENHTEDVGLYLMNRHLNRINVLVDICRQLNDNPMVDRFIRIVT